MFWSKRRAHRDDELTADVGAVPATGGDPHQGGAAACHHHEGEDLAGDPAPVDDGDAIADELSRLWSAPASRSEAPECQQRVDVRGQSPSGLAITRNSAIEASHAMCAYTSARSRNSRMSISASVSSPTGL